MKTLNQESLTGTIMVLLSAVCFSIAGVLIKLVPWASMSIQGIRSIFSFIVIGIYMLITHEKFVINKAVIFGAICNTVMAVSFVMANKLTTAANAIVLQFTEPVFVILLMWALYKKKPGKEAIITCIVVMCGILCFFFESLSTGGMAGNLLAIVSGFTYAFVMMMKQFPGASFESSLMISNVISMFLGVPFYMKETDNSLTVWLAILALGIIQVGLSYIFLSKGLDRVTPVTASLTSTIEPILNPLLVAIFYGETVGALALVGAVLVVGSATVYNLMEAGKHEKTEGAAAEKV